MAQKLYPLTIKKKTIECKDACTLILKPNEEDKRIFEYKPAQFLNFHLNLQNKEVVRSYSLSSSPLLEEELTTTIKKVSNGIASSFLIDQIKENDQIISTKPLGKFFRYPKSLDPFHYFIIGAGSGITPLFSIIKTVLACDDKNHVSLVYCNRSESSIIYKHELNQLQDKYKNRFKIIHVVSQPISSQYDFTGRLNKEILSQILKIQLSTNKLKVEYYLCGPLELMKMSENILFCNGVDKKAIHKESFGATISQNISSLKKENSTQPLIPETALVIQADIDNEISPPKKIQAFLEGEKIEVPSQSHLTILENLIESGHCPPFSCMAGSCMTCIATLKKGRIYQDEAGILDEENIENKEILTCQAKPLSSFIEVDYDS